VSCRDLAARIGFCRDRRRQIILGKGVGGARYIPPMTPCLIRISYPTAPQERKRQRTGHCLSA